MIESTTFFNDTNQLCSVLRTQYNTFLIKKDLYDAWYRERIELAKYQKKLKSKTPLIITIIVIILASIAVPEIAFTIIIGFSAIQGFDNSEFDSDKYISLFVVSSILAIAVPIFIYLMRKKSIKKKIQETETNLKNIQEELERYYYSVHNPLVSFDYSSPYVLEEICRIAEQGRAHTVNEAVNQYYIDAKEKLEKETRQKEVKRDRLLYIAATSAAIYSMSGSNRIDVYYD